MSAISKSISSEDVRWLRRTLALARRGRFTVDPNPCVGAVIVRGGEKIAEGFHRRPGAPHAEVDALSRLAPEAARGATLYVNLEPCCHQGRTPPCVDALVEAGVARVVACHRDPNPAVGGRGFDRLRRAGVEVVVGGPVEEAAAVNVAFLSRHLLSRPAVTLKWAMSLDGKIATRTGDSQWISSPEGRRWALELREIHAAILIGSGTLLDDDPRLDRRLGKAEGPIVRVVLDRRLRADPERELFRAPGPVLIYTEKPDDAPAAGRRRAERIASAGASVVELPAVTPASVVADLGERGLSSVLVEGGGRILQAFVDDGVFDRVALCCAPLLIGGAAAPGPLSGLGVADLAGAERLDGLRSRRRGPDLVLEAWRKGCLPDLLQRLAG